ncbi:sugar ABC transporter permease [Paenibacillus swuensis]|uniref:Sugar ABC transporter permease n=1 Tax=Paenibacillus swuensis TaxID=1178515 RepID=A0A172TJ52_9BACL|nr:carbohydrate ABC transporter permease [Paenibacillus swuensis]ANE47085.1 sugar ABC transporter permease [Paenibacillus swuensis]
MNNARNQSLADRLFDLCNIFFFALLLLIVLYPLYFILISSVSHPDSVNLGATYWLPDGFTLEGYRKIFLSQRIWQGYANSTLYVIVGTSIKLALTISAGYALSRKDMPGRQILMMLFVFTIFFQGGMIPSYLLVRELGLLDSIWAIVLPGAISVYHLIIVRTFFQSTIPDELLEASQMDGGTNWIFFFRIAMPLSLPIVAVVALFSAVAEWNAYFQALLYIKDVTKQPLQIVLRELLIQNQQSLGTDAGLDVLEQQNAAEQMKYGVVIIASLPMLVLYPFLQRYFVKGVMIGSIKG